MHSTLRRWRAKEEQLAVLPREEEGEEKGAADGGQGEGSSVERGEEGRGASSEEALAERSPLATNSQGLAVLDGFAHNLWEVHAFKNLFKSTSFGK